MDKRQVMINNCSDIVRYLHNALGPDNFINFIRLLIDENKLDAKLAANLTKPFSQHNEKKDRPALSEIAKERKKALAAASKNQLGKHDIMEDGITTVNTVIKR